MFGRLKTQNVQRTFTNQTRQDRMQLFEEIFVYKATDNTKQTNNIAAIIPGG